MENSNVTPLVPKDKKKRTSIFSQFSFPKRNSFRIRSICSWSEQGKKAVAVALRNDGEDKLLKVK